MVEVIQTEDFRLDRDSQRILMFLAENGESTTSELRSATDLSHNSGVLYRLREHLVDGGLVEGTGQLSGPGDSEGVKKWMVTDRGEHFAEEHIEELGQPATLEEACEAAQKALNDAETAKDSFQHYRQKLSRYVKKTKGLDSRVEEIEDQQEEDDASFGILFDRTESQGGEIDHNAERIEALDSRIDGLGDELERLDETVGAFEQELGQQKERTQNEIGEIRTLAEESEMSRMERSLTVREFAYGMVVLALFAVATGVFL